MSRKVNSSPGHGFNRRSHTQHPGADLRPDWNWVAKERNKMMRKDAQHKEEVTVLQNRIDDLEKENGELRGYLRELFGKDEEKVVSQSYGPDSKELKSVLKVDKLRMDKLHSDGLNSEPSVRASSGLNVLFSSSKKENTQGSTLANADLAPSFSFDAHGQDSDIQSRKKSLVAKKRDLKELSNIHQLYQDLFITDLKKEIQLANTEVARLRAVLTEKSNDQQENQKQIKELSAKLERYRKMFIESRKENDILFKKITQVIESAEMPDGDEILSLFEISRNPPQIVTSV